MKVVPAHVGTANADDQARLVVGIATAGRRDVLGRMLQQLAQQRRLPDRVIVCPATEQDFDASIAARVPYPIDVVRGARGLCAQRNLILEKASHEALIAFFDDDFYPAADFLANTARCFASSSNLVALTGTVIADGALGPGIEHDEALRLLAADTAPEARATRPIYNAYGCNMAFRLAPIREAGIRFDEKLPLYSWLEDVDFSRALSASGEIAHSDALRGVHLATKRGRTSGVRFGYSQIANPVYLARKGTFAWWRALRQIGRNVGANLAHGVRPEPWVDRKGRLKGNVLAVNDLVRGRLDPRRILTLH